MKKLIIAMMVIALVVVMAVSVSAEDLVEDIYSYKVNDDGNTVTITKINLEKDGDTLELNIPEKLGDKTVTAIGDKALDWGSSNKRVTKLTIPNTVVTIGAEAFDNNRAIKELVIPDSVKSIGDQAFIKFEALETLTIGKGLETAGTAAFGRMINIKTITVASENTNFKVVDGFLVNKDKGLLTGPSAEVLKFPAGIEYIDQYAFYGRTGVNTVIIPAGTKLLKTTCLQGISATTVIVPKSIETIEWAVFVNAKWDPDKNNGVKGDLYYEGTEEEFKAINWLENPDGKSGVQNACVYPNGTPRTNLNYNACMNNPNGWTHSEGATCTYCAPTDGNAGTTKPAPSTGSSVTVLAIVAVVALAATSVVISKRRIED